MPKKSNMPAKAAHAHSGCSHCSSHGHSTPQMQHDVNIIFKNGVPQQLVHAKIPYRDHNNKTKFVLATVYDMTHKTLPKWLPTLLPPPANPPYAIRDVPGKGKGLIATRNILEGEIVIVERPVIIYPLTMTTRDGFQRFQDYAKSIMDPQDLKKYNNLANVNKNDIPNKFLGIALTNSYGVDLRKGKEGYSGVCLEMARINHSCGPNLLRSWNPYLFAFCVQAVRPIKAGQELTLAYGDITDTHTDRRRELKSNYKFECECGYCTNTSPTSDRDRSFNSRDMLDIVAMYSNLVSPRLTLSMKQGMSFSLTIRLGEDMDLKRKEGVESLTEMWQNVFLMKTWALVGNMKLFKETGFKAVLRSVAYTDAEGQEARSQVEEWIGWLKEPETYPNWGCLQIRD